MLHEVLNLDKHVRCFITSTLTLSSGGSTDPLMCRFTRRACDCLKALAHFFFLSQHDSGSLHFTSCSASVFEVIWYLKRFYWLLPPKNHLVFSFYVFWCSAFIFLLLNSSVPLSASLTHNIRSTSDFYCCSRCLLACNGVCSPHQPGWSAVSMAFTL